jgi:hypothetical protein
MPGVVSHLLKEETGWFQTAKMVAGRFATVKGQKDGFGTFQKETGCCPVSFCSPQTLSIPQSYQPFITIVIVIVFTVLL